MTLDLTTFLVSFVIGLALYPWFIRALRVVRAGQVIQEELPDSHQKKAGTPTGGGILFVAMAVIGGVAASLAGHAGAIPSVFALLAGGAIGAVDDVSKLRRGSIGI
ncbi:MAG TPA: phospho-N-acetylmuramoyl-pentapeptide-transferase, partial [Candidatus Dormibacteraeota bacterium]|nr:phospho-N-acetylmuramoyl-pentapeptide-transferase [Candidatus Dormibacteraeota bacterium]